MNTLRNVGRDEPLTTEQGLYIKQQAVFAARRAFQGRKLFGASIRKIDSGSQTFGYDTRSRTAAAAIDLGWPGRLTMDAVNLTRSTVAIPNMHKEFEINKLDLASSRMSGEPLNTSNVEESAYQVAYLEDVVLINGKALDGTVYDFKGLYQTGKASGNYDTTGYVWSTVANIPTCVKASFALLLEDNIQPPWNLTINQTQWMQAFEFIGTTSKTYQDFLREACQGGSVYVTPAITAGTLMWTAVNPQGMFEYVLAEDLTTETETTSMKEGQNLFGRNYIRGIPVVYDANAICAVDDLT